MIQLPNEDRSWSSEKWSPKEDSSVAESCQMNVVETEYSDYSDYSFSEPNSGNETCKQENFENNSFQNENYSSEETVTVKFHINYENKTDELFTKAFNRNVTVMTIKSELKSLLQIPQHHVISIQKDDRELSDDISLTKLGVPVLGSVELHVRLTRVSSCKLDRDLIYGHMPTLDVITVRVQQNKNFVKHLVVEIEDERCQKSWLGGYRHRITRVEYHHAQTQTYSLRIRDDESNYMSRSTQAVSTKTQQTNTSIDKGVQISPHMFFIPSQTDRIIIADPNQRPESSHTVSEYTSQIYLDKEPEEIDEQHSETDENTSISEAINPLRILRPLRNEIEKWNATQNALLNNSPKDRETATQRTQIINQTVKFINRLNQFKTKLFQAQSSGQNLLFDKYTKANTFTSKTGSKISIQTVFNQHAETLKDLYMKYNNDTIKGVDKIRVIRDLVDFFKGTLSKSKFSPEIISLLEEQIDLLSRGLDKTNSLQSRVHQRIGHFLQYGGCNPNDDYDDSYFQIRYRFPLGTNSPSVHKLDVYWHLLSHLRNDEIQIFKCFTSVCFKMRPAEFAYLVREIWQDSPITQNDHNDGNSSHTDQWIMTRWNVREEWTPWNCVLITKPYFALHLKADNVECYYDASVLSSVKNNHLKSKMYFQKLIKLQIV